MNEWSANPTDLEAIGTALIQLSHENDATLREYQLALLSLWSEWSGQAADTAKLQITAWLQSADNLNQRLLATGMCLTFLSDLYNQMHVYTQAEWRS